MSVYTSVLLVDWFSSECLIVDSEYQTKHQPKTKQIKKVNMQLP